MKKLRGALRKKRLAKSTKGMPRNKEVSTMILLPFALSMRCVATWRSTMIKLLMMTPLLTLCRLLQSSIRRNFWCDTSAWSRKSYSVIQTSQKRLCATSSPASVKLAHSPRNLPASLDVGSSVSLFFLMLVWSTLKSVRCRTRKTLCLSTSNHCTTSSWKTQMKR